ncbi:MAG TPA: DUF6263 family protein [Bacteroidales bacterium]|nr:DUF6263 family protein [Bacteroidales bacterium]HOK74326.1 DUF6263 family protein [Bacteroidales bacterium]HOM39849.1 DUF6263 family protein [Bacteroidales bacterium]HOU30009.1 DUF6263 family protein [Bacteroidales bacterium]HPP92790.1 DUF6263 family protein [Bacteroidales bacterium]
MKKILLPVLSFVFILPVIAQQSVNLRLNPEKNKTYRLRSVSHQTVLQTVSGNQQTVESDVIYSFSLKMLDATPEFMVAEVHFDTLITKTNTMGRVETISSADEGDIKSSEASKVMSYIMNKLSKNAVFVKLNYAGQPLEIINAKILSDLILKDTASITLSEPAASALKTQIINTVSENNLKTMIKNFTWHLPAAQVSKGTEWKIYDQINSGGMLLMVSSKFRLEGLNGNNALITVESEIKVPENAPPIKSAGATVTYNSLTGMGKSNMVVDTETGLLVENKTQTRITGNLSISAPGFSMEMPMDINGETVVRAVK